MQALRAVSRRASRAHGAGGHRALATAGEAKGKHVPFGEIGSGYYSDHTKGCYDVVQRSKSVAMDALGGVLSARAERGAASKDEPFTIVDYGTADAGTSMPLMNDIVAAVRNAEPSTQIVVLYEDQSTNDWNSVFARVHNRLPNADRSFLAGGDSNIFVLASGESFYGQCTPNGTVDLGYSSTAMHWLRSAPTTVPDAILDVCSDDEGVRAAYREQSAGDWIAILSQRARELKSGGALAIANFAVDPEGQFLGKSRNVGQSMHHTFAKLWLELVAEKVITMEEFTNTNFPIHYRTLEECKAPFEGSGSELTDLGLRSVSGETDLVRCPYHERWLREGGDALAHAESFVPTTRTWSNSTFVSGLDTSTRTPEEADAIVQKFFERYIKTVAADPENHAMDYVHSYLHIVKA